MKTIHQAEVLREQHEAQWEADYHEEQERKSGARSAFVLIREALSMESETIKGKWGDQQICMTVLSTDEDGDDDEFVFETEFCVEPTFAELDEIKTCIEMLGFGSYRAYINLHFFHQDYDHSEQIKLIDFCI